MKSQQALSQNWTLIALLAAIYTMPESINEGRFATPSVNIKRSLYATFLFYMFARPRSINSHRKHRAAMLTR